MFLPNNRPDTLDPALTRPGRLDRKVEFSLPDLEVNKFFLFYFCGLKLIKGELDGHYNLKLRMTVGFKKTAVIDVDSNYMNTYT